MNPRSHGIPERIDPYILMGALNQPVDLAAGRFELACGEITLGNVEGRLYLRWQPTTAMEFDGEYSGDRIDLSEQNVILIVPERGLRAQVIITSAPTLSPSGQVRGVFRRGASVTTGSVIDRIRFCLVNFPEYFGDPIRYKTEHSGKSFTGRLRASSSRFSLIVDAIPEMDGLRKAAARESGFVISHVAKLKPLEGHFDEALAEDALNLMHFFFGFLRGAWSGPVFPQGFTGDKKTWEQLASWRVSEGKEVSTWLPQRHPLELDGLLSGFAECYSDKTRRLPLIRAVGWYIEANSSGSLDVTRLVLGQVALELLAWVEVVETRHLHSRGDFKRLSAAGKMRSLLQHLQIPCDVPPHLGELQNLQGADAFDGPGVLVRLRNALVHAGEKNPARVGPISGTQWWLAGQLALQYVELSLLALCGYQGTYARRGWRGWKGDDEVQVPWAQTGQLAREV